MAIRVKVDVAFFVFDDVSCRYTDRMDHHVRYRQPKS